MKNILVIDDSQFNLMVVDNALSKEYNVTIKQNGKDGIKYAKENTIDLILLDIEMPEMSGIDTIKILKKDAKLSKIPIIFLTGFSDHEMEKMCLDLGARDFITKPFNEPVMLQRIKIVLELESLRKNLERQVRVKTEQLEKLTAQIISTFANSVDPLTDLWSRMYIKEKICNEIEREPLRGALAVINLDNFRVINDALGFKQGDLCLKTVADAIKDVLQNENQDEIFVGRSGADEFLLYMANANTKEEVEVLIKNICAKTGQDLEENKFKGVTLSAGVAMTIQAKESFGELYYLAEKALHWVKCNGKNNISFAE